MVFPERRRGTDTPCRRTPLGERGRSAWAQNVPSTPGALHACGRRVEALWAWMARWVRGVCGWRGGWKHERCGDSRVMSGRAMTVCGQWTSEMWSGQGARGSVDVFAPVSARALWRVRGQRQDARLPGGQPCSTSARQGSGAGKRGAKKASPGSVMMLKRPHQAATPRISSNARWLRTCTSCCTSCCALPCPHSSAHQRRTPACTATGVSGSAFFHGQHSPVLLSSAARREPCRSRALRPRVGPRRCQTFASFPEYPMAYPPITEPRWKKYGSSARSPCLLLLNYRVHLLLQNPQKHRAAVAPKSLCGALLGGSAAASWWQLQQRVESAIALTYSITGVSVDPGKPSTQFLAHQSSRWDCCFAAALLRLRDRMPRVLGPLYRLQGH